ncbi:MAG TPA: hypothetical protein VKU94_03965 [Geobacterales bacterium]|nr:hypothetical protein [Geobacterales bacterium]
MEKNDTFEQFANQFAKEPAVLESAVIGMGKLLRFLAKLNDEGILDSLNKILEDEERAKLIVNSLPQITKFFESFLKNVDQEFLAQYLEKFPIALNAALKEFEKESKGMGFWELLSAFRKPEFSSLIRAMDVFLKNLK